MINCYSRWQGRIQRPANKPLFWEMECGTCGLKLENGKVPTRCGLDGFYSRRAAVRMGSLNANLWGTRQKLTYWQELLKDLTTSKQVNTAAIETQNQYRKQILLLMREKRNPDRYADLVKWDENLKNEATKR